MLNTKLNLYNAEWLDVVFSDRNKAYGAYDLRNHYGQTMVKAMGIAFTSIIAAALLYNYAVKQPISLSHDREVIVELPSLPTVVPPKKEVQPVKTVAAKPLPPVKTTAFLPPVVTSEPVTTDPPVIDKIVGEVGAVTTTGTGKVPPIVETPVTSGGGGTAPKVDDSEHTTVGLQVMPEPDGGAAGWAKFLSRNLRFPAQAQDANVGGRVLISFVIEKDGRLSDLTVINKAGYGMDEEALRVLKLAKPWKPGMQNGQPVRVRYTIPMNFQLSE
ncbi:energy transducer TonB [Inquilinus sp. KBS0705]|nr:energy transducer TonB [Inquilinus sp. KBS0705]